VFTRQAVPFPRTVAGIFCLSITLGHLVFPKTVFAVSDTKSRPKSTLSSDEEFLQDFGDGAMPGSPAVDRKNRALATASFAEGQRLSQAQQFNEALSRYLEAAEADPGYSPTIAQIALLLIRLDRKEEAISLLTKQVQLRPEASRLHSLLAFCLFDPNNPIHNTLAVDHARRALELDPTQIGNYRILAQDRDTARNPARLQKLLGQAQETASQEGSFHIRMAEIWSRILLESGTPPSAVSLQILPFYEKAYQSEPSNPDYAFQLGQIHFDAGNYSQALSYYLLAYERNRKIPGLRERLALSYMSCDRENEAISVLEDLLAEFPERKNLYTTIGELYERAGKWQEAAKYYSLYIELHPPNAEDYIRLAQAQVSLKKPESALTTLEAAEKDFPTLPPILLLKSIILRSLRQVDAALLLLSRVEKNNQSDPTVLNAAFYFQYGATLGEARLFDQAEIKLKKCLELNPHHHQALNYLGYLWADQNIHLPEAEKLIQAALKLSPDHPGYQDSLGWVNFRLGRHEAAKELFLQALTKSPDDPEILEHLGHTYYQLGATPEALECWKNALTHTEKPDELQAAIQKISGQMVEMKP
jgi:tetratricopeptide (TPR) repeat protein